MMSLGIVVVLNVSIIVRAYPIPRQARPRKDQCQSKRVRDGPVVPSTGTVLPRCSATETCWMRWACDLASCVSALMHLLHSAKNSSASQLKAPDVSITMGTKGWVWARIWYLPFWPLPLDALT